MTQVLIIIAKECLPGKAKTRLTPPLSPQQAARIAQASLNETIATAMALSNVHRILYFDGNPDSLLPFFPTLKDDFTILPQISGELDVRLGHVFDEVNRRFGDDTRTALIGMDTPQVTTRLLSEVFDDSGQEDSWLGLTADGGYWLIGMQHPTGDVIHGVPMSQDDTGDHQLTAMLNAGLDPRLLAEQVDIDHWADAKHVATIIPDTFFAAEVEEFNELLSESTAFEYPR